MAATDEQNDKESESSSARRRLLAQLHPRNLSYRKLALSLAIGTLGGWLFARAGLPLPWMLGSMSAVLIAALLRAPVGMPGFLRTPMVTVIGVLLGAGFMPDTLANAANWLVSIAGLIAFSLVCALAGGLWFRFVARADPVTSYFSGMPGGLVEMVIQGEERGGDARFIALVHAARIFLIVMTLPFLVQALTGADFSARSSFGPSASTVPIVDWAWLAGVAIVGWALGRLLRLPAAALIGPLLVSAMVHLVGWTASVPPNEVVMVAQIVIGTTIGCRFVGIAPREIGRIFALSGGYTLILLGVTWGFAALLSWYSDFEFIPLILAYSPGGLPEMSLMALSLQIEVAFVATHHVLRVLIVMLGATPIFLIWRRFFGRT